MKKTRKTIIPLVFLLVLVVQFSLAMNNRKDTSNEMVHIGILIYPGVFQLDATAPYSIFAAAKNTKVHLIGKTISPIQATDGLILTPTVTFEECPKLTVFCVPGGGGLFQLLDDKETLSFIRNQSEKSQYITSVCTGSLLLAATGVLNGYQATTHWHAQELLETFEQITWVQKRVVIDRNRITASGITAGIDMALVVVGKIHGEDEARKIELLIEYDPSPPFKSGHPSFAPDIVVNQFNEWQNPMQEKRKKAIKQAAEELKKNSKKTSIQLVRNATLILQYAEKKILVDPMLAAKGTFESRAGIAKNPTTELPIPLEEITSNVDLVLVSHTHQDHFDKAAIENINHAIKLIGQPSDQTYYEKLGFTNIETISSQTTWNNITIHRTEAQHGKGEVQKIMGHASGFVLQTEGEPTIYIVGDAIWTEEIKLNIQKFKPDYIVINTGGAVYLKNNQAPIIMNELEALEVTQASGNATIIAVHMEALDHCLTTRNKLRNKIKEANIEINKFCIPNDGEIIYLK